ncbi:hypothetical protein LOK49_LG03G02411 [Camellia lanceoleosa]|uniref:Uncharacterized protein n=1 Tax=Camellia lanceoleosa TaxID=1840588 RepID=A0ACC0IGC6_9ERIC|nr:hypothetical protein LOK49_LG03G02411 [Camellia lanceoleosa]
MDEKVEVSELPHEYVADAKHYQILSAMGMSEGVTLYKAWYLQIPSPKPDSEEAEAMVGIEVIDTYKVKDIFNFTREVQWAKQLRHENLLQVH